MATLAIGLLEYWGYTDIESATLDSLILGTIKVQLVALGFINFAEDGKWRLTTKGLKATVQIRAIQEGHSR